MNCESLPVISERARTPQALRSEPDIHRRHDEFSDGIAGGTLSAAESASDPVSGFSDSKVSAGCQSLSLPKTFAFGDSCSSP